MPETMALSFNVGRLKFHMACPRYSAGGALKIAGSNGLAAFWADNPTARRTIEIANRNIRYTPFSSSLIVQQLFQILLLYGSKRLGPSPIRRVLPRCGLFRRIA